jgi:hypothetical protein
MWACRRPSRNRRPQVWATVYYGADGWSRPGPDIIANSAEQAERYATDLDLYLDHRRFLWGVREWTATPTMH